MKRIFPARAHRASAKYGALIVSSVAMCACQTLQDRAASPSAAESSAAAQTTVINPPAPMPAPPKPTALSQADAQATPLPIVKPPVTTLNRGQIVGADAADVRALIGAPETIVASAPSQTWFYAGGPCRFSLQFFKDLESGNYRALKYDVEGGTLERCLAQFERLHDVAVVADKAAAPAEQTEEENAVSAARNTLSKPEQKPQDEPQAQARPLPMAQKSPAEPMAETAGSGSDETRLQPDAAPLGAQTSATTKDEGGEPTEPSG